MIKRLVVNGVDKDAWCKGEDYISNVLHEDTMLTLENTSETIKRVQTYLDRDMMSSDTPTAVLQTDTSESKAILTLKAELAEIKAAHVKATTTQGRQLNNKRRREGGPRTAPKDAVKCKTCGLPHRGQ